MADITMPQLGETVTEGTITRWIKNVGDNVAEDDVLFEVSTDKVDSEVPSPAAGVLSEILVQEGETVDVGTRLAVISPPGSQPAPPEEPAAEAEAEAAAPEEAAPEAEKAAPAAQAAEPDGGPVAAPEPEPEPEPAAVAAIASKASAAADDTAPDSRVLSPVVRRLLSEHSIDPTQIQGTGSGGRITRSDVLSYIDRHNGAGAAPQAPPRQAPSRQAPPAAAAPSPATAPERPPVPTPAPLARAEGERDTIVPFTNIRRRTAEHMVRSKQTSAHTMVAVEVDYSEVEKVRAAEKERFRAAEGFGLTYLPFVSRAVVDAIEDFPHVNSSVGDDVLIVHNDVHLGIAVDLDFEGLLVPVIHQADSKRLRALAREISDLAARARAKRLTMDDISGGTFTITNAGPFGTFITVPVINQPQVGILSTDGVRKRPVAVELPDGSDAVAIHPVGNLVLSWDHRAFDGAYAAAFVAAVKRIIETRDWSAEL